MLMYLSTLVIYGLLNKILLPKGQSSTAADAVFFAMASVVTLSAITIVKGNVYS
jgi:hypothetical protein